MTLLKRNAYPLIVFLTGAAVLVIEIAATRILAPWFGNTIYTFSSVISVILAALSIGYYLGGKLCDRWPSPRLFFSLIAGAGISVYLCQVLANFLLPVLATQLSIMAGPLVLSLLMFFVPGTILGMLSPWAIKLHSQANPQEGIGVVSGKIFFWSTFGSILGSLSTGFFLVPRFGLEAIMIASATLLAVLGIAGLVINRGASARGTVALVIAAAISAAGAYASLPGKPAGVIFRTNGLYEMIAVRDTIYNNRPARLLMQDRTVSGLQYLDNGETLDYVKFPAIARLFKPETRNALAIGGGTYLLPRNMLDNYPGATIDVAEIEPQLYEIARKYFNIPNDSKLRNHIMDGRMFLARSKKFYDVIFADIYYGMTVPSHFTTLEYHQLVRSKLTPGGLYMANLVGDLDTSDPNIVLAQMRVIREVFPNSEFIATSSAESTDTQSIVAIARNGDAPLDFSSAEITDNPNPLVRGLAAKRVNTHHLNLDSTLLFTDDYAPAEHYASFSLKKELSN